VALALPVLPELDSLEVAKAWAGRERWDEAAHRVQQAMERDEQLRRPLFAAMLGDAISRGQEPGMLDAPTVAKIALERLLPKETASALEYDARILFALATAGQGVAEGDLLEEPTQQALLGRVYQRRDLTQLTDALRRLDPHHGQGLLVAPLEPDYLGELFVLRTLLDGAGQSLDKQVLAWMHLAWAKGKETSPFVARLAGDFLGRELQVAEALGERVEAVSQALAAILLTATDEESFVYVQPTTVAVLVDLSTKSSDRSLSGQILQSMQRLHAALGTPESALEQAKALYNATVVEPEAAVCYQWAQEIGLLRQQHNTAEIALAQAQALHNATVGEPEAAACYQWAQEIGLLRQQHNTAEIALAQARALHNATVGEPEAAACYQWAQEIGLLRQQHNTAEIALAQAQALNSATAGEPEAAVCYQRAQEIGLLRQQHNTAEIALEQARALWVAGHLAEQEGNRTERERLHGEICEFDRAVQMRLDEWLAPRGFRWEVC